MGHFLPFYSLITAWKIKKIKFFFFKLKKSMKISSFYISVPKIMIRWYTVPEIWCVTGVIVSSHFGLFFCSFTLRTIQKIKILKKWKICLEMSSFYIYVPKIMIRWCTVLKICCVTEVINISHSGLFFPLLPP